MVIFVVFLIPAVFHSCLSIFVFLSDSVCPSDSVFLISYSVSRLFCLSRFVFCFKKKVCNVFKPWRETRSLPSLFQDCVLPQIIKLIVSSSEKILDNLNVVVGRQVKWQNSPPSVTVHGPRFLELHGNLSREKNVKIKKLL